SRTMRVLSGNSKSMAAYSSVSATKAEFGQSDIIGDIFKRHFDLVADLDLIVRHADDVADHARTFFELDDGHVVRNILRVGLVINLMKDNVGENLPTPRQLHPPGVLGQTAWADMVDGVTDMLAFPALLHVQLMALCCFPERTVIV